MVFYNSSAIYSRAVRTTIIICTTIRAKTTATYLKMKLCSKDKVFTAKRFTNIVMFCYVCVVESLGKGIPCWELLYMHDPTLLNIKIWLFWQLKRKINFKITQNKWCFNFPSCDIKHNVPDKITIARKTHADKSARTAIALCIVILYETIQFAIQACSAHLIQDTSNLISRDGFYIYVSRDLFVSYYIYPSCPINFFLYLHTVFTTNQCPWMQ